MFTRAVVTISRRAAALQSLRRCTVAVRQQSMATLAKRLQPSSSMSVVYEQKRGSKIEVFGPFDPPKQPTFEQVEKRVLKAIRAWDRWPQDRNDQLKLDVDFVNDLGLDSLDHVEIIMALEDEFGFEIPDTDAEKMKTPRDIFNYICEREDVFE